jgi:hypothetical protein
LASTTLDALIGVDVQLVFAIEIVDTVNGTNAYAGFIFNVNARLGNYKRHVFYLQYSIE